MLNLKMKNSSTKNQSQLVQCIDSVTDGHTQVTENWTMFMTICDIINSFEDGPKDSLKAFRKRFATKHQQSIALTLALLETCVKNCGKRFHIQLATKDFMQDFVKIISPKNSPTVENQNTVLRLIQTWSYAFQNSPELKEVNRSYNELKVKGVEFPAFDSEQASKAFIPDKMASTVAITEVSKSQPYNSHVHGSEVTQPIVSLPQDKLAKLKSELTVVQQNCKVFLDLLSECSTGSPTSVDIELMEELNGSCRHMQNRIMELIQVVQVENITEELLIINDELNNAFIRYDRYKRLHNSSLENKPQIPPLRIENVILTNYKEPQIYEEIEPNNVVDNLIDFGDTPSFSNSAINVDKNKPQSSDLFAQWNSEPPPNVSEVEIREMEEWLKMNKGDANLFGTEEKYVHPPQSQAHPGESATSHEFDLFLSQRASAVLTLPPK